MGSISRYSRTVFYLAVFAQLRLDLVSAEILCFKCKVVSIGSEKNTCPPFSTYNVQGLLKAKTTYEMCPDKVTVCKMTPEGRECGAVGETVEECGDPKTAGRAKCCVPEETVENVGCNGLVLPGHCYSCVVGSAGGKQICPTFPHDDDLPFGTDIVHCPNTPVCKTNETGRYCGEDGDSISKCKLHGEVCCDKIKDPGCNYGELPGQCYVCSTQEPKCRSGKVTSLAKYLRPCGAGIFVCKKNSKGRYCGEMNEKKCDASEGDICCDIRRLTGCNGGALTHSNKSRDISTGGRYKEIYNNSRAVLPRAAIYLIFLSILSVYLIPY